MLAERVSSEESIARLVSTEWVLNGILQPTAFTLNQGESYLSVNRPAVETYDSDVAAFIQAHPSFRIVPEEPLYYRAMMNVGEVRSCDIKVGQMQIKIDVDVEPRDLHTKSHAGIFTRYEDKNLRLGQTFQINASAETISTDSVLLEVRTYLMDIATLEQCVAKDANTCH
jgi:hypothetical protein